MQVFHRMHAKFLTMFDSDVLHCYVTNLLYIVVVHKGYRDSYIPKMSRFIKRKEPAKIFSMCTPFTLEMIVIATLFVFRTKKVLPPHTHIYFWNSPNRKRGAYHAIAHDVKAKIGRCAAKKSRGCGSWKVTMQHLASVGEGH